MKTLYDKYRRRISTATTQLGCLCMHQRFFKNGGEISSDNISIDSIFISRGEADRTAVVISGTHGLEGPIGAEFQLRLLNKLAADYSDVMPEGVNILLIFALNPWGFKYGERTNEDNIDLNRNAFSKALDTDSSDHELILDVLLPDEWSDQAGANLLARVRDLGLEKFKQIFSQGQYKYPDSLFFGGTEESWNITTLRNIVEFYLGESKKAVVLDVHTGLGERAEGVILSPAFPEEIGLRARTVATFGDCCQFPNTESSISSKISGDILSGIMRWKPGIEFLPVALEIGVLPVKDSVERLVRANWVRQNRNKVSDNFYRQSKRDLWGAFFPEGDQEWMEESIEACFGSYSLLLNWLVDE
ncbi:MAG: DUF2817 domain-containing protein [Candidatus Magasanikbacteria bacterium]|nr:DUF2817 domain-containing protein [Candidatus Magasanikbacteria bacterium]